MTAAYIIIGVLAVFAVSVLIGRILALNGLDESESRLETMRRIVPPREEQEK